MSAVDRPGATQPRWDRPSRNPLGLVAGSRRPLSTCTWLPDGPRSAQRTHRSPVYVSFVSKAILWDRGLCHYPAHVHPTDRTSLCPRFLSHMKACPGDFRPPCFLSSTLRPQPPPQGTTTHILLAPKTQTLEGCFHFDPERRGRAVHSARVNVGRRAAVAPPRPPLPATPPPSSSSSSSSPTPPRQRSLRAHSGRQQSGSSTAPPSPPGPRLPSEDKHESPEKERAPQPAVVSIAESAERDGPLNLGPAGPVRSETPASAVSHGSLSDWSRPPSSLFSRSTDLSSGRSSVLSGVTDTDPEGSVCLSPLHLSSVMELPLSASPAGPTPHGSTTSTTTHPPYEPDSRQTKAFSPRPTSSIQSHSHKPLSSSRSSKPAEKLPHDASTDPALNLSLPSDHGLVTLTFTPTTWSSCPSPQRSTPPSPPLSGLESQRWPVLPPISPVRGRCGTAASRYSELSCTQSHVFDELEAIAPLSTSCLSLDEASDSSGTSSPDSALSPGLAALTVGCDSGNLGSLSRVQLLLLDRAEPETLQSAGSFEENWDELSWSSAECLSGFAGSLAFLSVSRTMFAPGTPLQTGVLRPRTSGSISERCDSAGKVQEARSDASEGGSWSSSSWIIDPTHTSACSPCPSHHDSCLDDGGHDDESDHPGWRDDTGRSEERDTKMEERKTKVMHLLSKLQDTTPRKRNSPRGPSDFEDFDFLAKYCIFSQEKLAEYKRAFEAEDSDGDGYISCLQVLLALKNIIPPELLSDEEEIYVYRILEMVDFRVTDGLVDLRLFAVIASLAQKIATMDFQSLSCFFEAVRICQVCPKPEVTYNMTTFQLWESSASIIGRGPGLNPEPTDTHHCDLNSASVPPHNAPYAADSHTRCFFFPALGFIASYRQECVEPSLLWRSPWVKACSLALE
ncbi:uncharacterized protein LOC114861695 isoform X2 [Betta splendens]|uniref:Uncharacterized protein LOC114861695 isoform X2 n=1 Tax=Betta splendens TaxID=158456 RepID=A0A9W2Y2M1_BETSP|nr:uncharacterized protein LOC114861695 isoform X2 [Betta splendens]